MPLILNQKRYALEFDDIIGYRYHYPLHPIHRI